MKRLFLVMLFAAGLVTQGASAPAHAQDKYIGEIIWVGYNFCPRATLEADGQLLAISQNAALFSLYGTTFGGDGRTTFALPDLRGRAALHLGTGPGLATRQLGSRGGAENTNLSTANLPSHTHALTLKAASERATRAEPEGAVPAKAGDYRPDGTLVDLSPSAGSVALTGGSQPVNNMQPYLTIRACVVIQGIFPSRS